MMPTQRGNALWMILLAIALLGGLTAMFARSSSTSDDTGDYERNSIAASEIMRYAKSLEIGVQNLITRGCSENDISFWNDSNGDGTENGSDDYYNANAPSDRSCHVFWPEGAGLTPMTPKADWLDASKSALGNYGNYTYAVAQMAGVNSTTDPLVSTDMELVLILPYLKKSTCQGINATLDIPPAGTDVLSDGFVSTINKFTGSYPTGAGTTLANFDEARSAGCLKNTNPTSEYTFFSAILAR